MRLSYQSGGYALSTLRSYLACDGSGFNTASSMRGQFFGYASTGAMSFAANSWIMSRCWTLAVDAGSGKVIMLSPYDTGPQQYLGELPYAHHTTTSHPNENIYLGVEEVSNWTFGYWLRADPYEVWSYFQTTHVPLATPGLENIYYVGAVFNYNPPPPPSECYYFYVEYDYWGIDCDGNYQSGFSWGEHICMQSVDYGGWQAGESCDNTCTVKGTSIEMADGTTKLIEKIRVGDLLKGMKISDAPEDDTIIGWSTDTLNLIETEVVVMGIRPYASQRIHNFNNGLIETSESHAHFIKRGNDWFFEQARNIQVGDFLVDKEGNSIEITSINVSQGEDRKIVYSMDVENTDTYIANGLITHNQLLKPIE